MVRAIEGGSDGDGGGTDADTALKEAAGSSYIARIHWLCDRGRLTEGAGSEDAARVVVVVASVVGW